MYIYCYARTAPESSRGVTRKRSADRDGSMNRIMTAIRETAAMTDVINY